MQGTGAAFVPVIERGQVERDQPLKAGALGDGGRQQGGWRGRGDAEAFKLARVGGAFNQG